MTHQQAVDRLQKHFDEGMKKMTEEQVAKKSELILKTLTDVLVEGNKEEHREAVTILIRMVQGACQVFDEKYAESD